MGSRSRGQVGVIFSAEIRQTAQKAWPHGVSTGSQSSSRQMGQWWRESTGVAGVHMLRPKALETSLCWALDQRSCQALIPSGVVIIGGRTGDIALNYREGEQKEPFPARKSSERPIIYSVPRSESCNFHSVILAIRVVGTRSRRHRASNIGAGILYPDYSAPNFSSSSLVVHNPTTRSSMGSEASFYTALEVQPSSPSSISSCAMTAVPERTRPPYRPPKPLPYELREHCVIYFEEELCTYNPLSSSLW